MSWNTGEKCRENLPKQSNHALKNEGAPTIRQVLQQPKVASPPPEICDIDLIVRTEYRTDGHIRRDTLHFNDPSQPLRYSLRDLQSRSYFPVRKSHTFPAPSSMPERAENCAFTNDSRSKRTLEALAIVAYLTSFWLRTEFVIAGWVGEHQEVVEALW
ncbi:hypothetical protein BKA93DRAFT_883055 [Sparassis latifolia]